MARHDGSLHRRAYRRLLPGGYEWCGGCGGLLLDGVWVMPGVLLARWALTGGGTTNAGERC